MSPLANVWTVLHTAVDGSPFLLHTVGSLLVVLLSLLVYNLPFAVVDITGRPISLTKYKIQETKKTPVNWETYKKALGLTVFNAVVVSGLTQLCMYPVNLRTMSCSPELPSLGKIVWDLAVCLIVIEILFYYVHRLFHVPYLYRYAHKIHHEWIAPVSVSSIYCHPLEYLFSNLLPVLLGPCIAGSHVFFAWFWYSLIIFFTTLNHCGYHFPFLPSNEFHDFHHAKFNQCYGSLGLLDWLHSTDGSFRKGDCYRRHVILTRLTPAKVLYPDSRRSRQQR